MGITTKNLYIQNSLSSVMYIFIYMPTIIKETLGIKDNLTNEPQEGALFLKESTCLCGFWYLVLMKLNDPMS